jgi:hypothetical protein
MDELRLFINLTSLYPPSSKGERERIVRGDFRPLSYFTPLPLEREGG